MWLRAVHLALQLAVYPHGLTDAWTHSAPTVALAYGTAALAAAAVPDPLWLFLPMSAIHFDRDGAVGRLVTPLAVSINYVSADAALGVVGLYLVYHTAYHYRRALVPARAYATLMSVGLVCAVLNVDARWLPRLSTALVGGHTLVHELGTPRNSVSSRR